MNILVFSWRDPKHPFAGGAEQVMHEHMKGWIEAGHSVTLFSSYYKKAKREESFNKIKIIRRGVSLLGVQILGFIYYLRKGKRYDLIIDEFHGIPFFTPLYVKKPKMAVLQEVAREVWFLNHFPLPLNYFIGLAGYLFEPLVYFLYRKVDFMVGSNSAKKDLIKMGIPFQKVTVVPHGVIVNYPKSFPPKEKIKTIVFLGALAKDKGIEEAIKVFYLLSKKDKYQFWVIGKGGRKYLPKLFSLCERLGVKSKITFWGYVDQKIKFDLLARSHVFINPSIREGWGLVNIEANAMGVPIVAFNSPGLIDSVKNNVSGLIVKKNTPGELAKEIEKLFNNPSLLRKLHEGALRWSKRFSWSISRQLSLKLISRIANSD